MKLSRVLPLIAVSLCPLFAASLAAKEPLNLSTAKAAVAVYCDSGDYEKEIGAVMAQARVWIERRAAGRKTGERLAVVMDLDETVLANTDHMRKLDYGYLPVEWDAYVMKAETPVFASARSLIGRIRELGVELIYITGRREPKYRACTEANLIKQGLSNYSRLLMISEKAPKRMSAEHKRAMREALEQEGLVIIANIGDQESDLSGGFSEKTFKVPNPFYLSK